MDRISSPTSYLVFRLYLGVYLAVHFLQLLPYGGALFSNEGMIPNATVLPTFPFFPNVLFYSDSPWVISAFLLTLAAGACAFAGGLQRAWLSIFLWYGLACLVNRNIFIRNPGMPYVGWVLLATALIPRVNLQHRSHEWEFPRFLFRLGWILMALGYSLSGIHKSMSPSWQDGSALLRLFENPLSRPTLISGLLLSLPPIVLKIMSWGMLTFETVFAPICLWSGLRKWAWTGMVFVHIGIMWTVDFVDLTLGVLVIHFFTFDPRWLPAVESEEKPIIFFDGVCALCNGFVDWLVREDTENKLLFSSLQGKTFESSLASEFSSMNSLVLKADGQVFQRSDAILRIASYLGGFWRLFWILRWVPGPLRDGIYEWVARHRYRFFGKSDTCRLPSLEERKKFLP